MDILLAIRAIRVRMPHCELKWEIPNILDGQQRLTALFQSLFQNNPVKTEDDRKKAIKRWYYIDMAIALKLNADRDDAIIGLPEDRKVTDFRTKQTKEYSTPEAEFQNLLFPLNQVLDPSDWRMKYNEYWNHTSSSGHNNKGPGHARKLGNGVEIHEAR